MSKIEITVLFGRQKVQVEAEEAETFGEVRAAVEKQTGVVPHGIRLLHKGKTMADATVLQTAGVKTGTKLMAMRTQKQHAVEKQQNKLNALQSLEKPSVKPTDRSEAQAVQHADQHPSTSRVICGDDYIDGQCHVIVSKGRARYRINIELTALVKDVKERLCTMDGVDGVASNVRLLSKGKFLTDANALAEQGVKPGGTMMAMFNARHHDTQEARTYVARIADEVAHMETEIRTWLKQSQKRVITPEEVSLQRSTFTQDVRRVRDNLNTVHVSDERIDALQKRLDELDKMLEDA